jgi:hypothetical protein
VIVSHGSPRFAAVPLFRRRRRRCGALFAAPQPAVLKIFTGLVDINAFFGAKRRAIVATLHRYAGTIAA